MERTPVALPVLPSAAATQHRVGAAVLLVALFAGVAALVLDLAAVLRG